MQVSVQQIAAAVAKSGRKLRSPEHPFYLRNLPWAIQPFCIAPVLPGETMKNALLQARVVTDPIKAPLIGWHCEFYVFYVKLRDLDIRDDLTEMLLTPGKDMSAHFADYDERMFHVKGRINYPRLCLNRVVEEYFRDEGDAPALLDAATGRPGLPPATFATKDMWWQSAKLESAVPAGDTGELPGQDDWMDANIPPEWQNHWIQFERMRALKLTEVTFEDWLRQFGVTPPAEVKEELHKPELLRYVRDWAYPSNTVDPETGVPNSVVSWAIAERLDKARLFKEPGFIFGVTVARPKVYLGRQHGAAVQMLDDAFSWLPALMQGDPYTSLKRFTRQAGPLGHPDVAAQGADEAYWVDMRDLFLYGDQFANFFMDTTNDQNVLLRPAGNLERRYATTAEAQALFVDSVGGRDRVRMDGVIAFSIASHNAEDAT